MKRKIALALALSICFCGCGKKEEVKEEKAENEKISEENLDTSQDDNSLDISWNNSLEDYDSSMNTVISFEGNGSKQEFELGAPIGIKELDEWDIDNDGDLEYVITGYFANTATEYYTIYAFEEVDDKIVQVFPFDELEEEFGELINCEVSEVRLENGGESGALNAIFVTAFDKWQDDDGPFAYESATGLVYCLDGQWHIKDAQFKTYEKTIEEVAAELVIPDEAEIEYEDWVDTAHTVYRVALQRTEEDSDEYLHLMDYFMCKEDDGSVITVKVDYPSINDSLYSDRYIGAVCDFSAEFVDVTFDGHNDLIISLGRFGAQGAAGYCAYVYEDGKYVYKKSFEEIPNYVLDESNHCITGSSRGNAVTYYDLVYEYIDGEFVNTDTQETVYSE